MHFLKMHLLTAHLSYKAQKSCELFLSQHSFSEIKQSLICGISFVMEPHFNLFMNLNLYHVLVVSAGNLMLWSSLIKILTDFIPAKLSRLKFILSSVVLFLLSLMVGFCPPIAKAFITQVLIASGRWHRRSPVILSAWGFCSVLMLFPDWVNSRSFNLSCWCSLILVVCQLILNQNKKWVFLVEALLIQWFLSLLFFEFNLKSVFANLIYAPVISFVLIPLSYFSLLSLWIDACFGFFYKSLILNLEGLNAIAPDYVINRPSFTQWVIFIFALSSLRYFELTKRKRWLSNESLDSDFDF